MQDLWIVVPVQLHAKESLEDISLLLFLKFHFASYLEEPSLHGDPQVVLEVPLRHDLEVVQVRVDPAAPGGGGVRGSLRVEGEGPVVELGAGIGRNALHKYLAETEQQECR